MKKFRLPLIAFTSVALLVAGCKKAAKDVESQAPVEVSQSKSNAPIPAGQTVVLPTPGEGIRAKSSSIMAVTALNDPDAAYVAATTLINISALTNFTNYASVTDGNQTVTFAAPLNKRGPVPSGWATWASPPNAETANPHVLFSSANTLSLTLSKKSNIFGFELEPNTFAAFTYNVDFYNGLTLVGSVSRSVNGSAGSRLFAAQTQDLPFDNVQISIASGSSGGFAIGQIRYNDIQIVDFDIKPAGCNNPFNVNSKGVLPTAVLGTATFNVNTIDVSTLQLNGVPALRSSLEDVGTPVANRVNDCDCNPAGADGNTDLTIKFDSEAIAASLGLVADGDQVVLTLTGSLLDGTPLQGKDCIVVIKKK